jgi:L-lactate dehydrogenase complex protein LldG
MENSRYARAHILASIRGKLNVRGDEPGRRGKVHTRLRQPKAGLIPGRVNKTRGELIKLFQTMLDAAGAKSYRAKTVREVAPVIATALRDANLALRIRCGEDPLIRDALAEPGLLEILHGAAKAEDQVSLSRAAAAAAETGTLFLLSGSENPSTLNFLPETHVVLIKADDIAGAYEECWAKIRNIYGPGQLPRTVNLISGPSRTADIEQTIVMGAHGPRQLLAVIIG